jgi:hypothetical protein
MNMDGFKDLPTGNTVSIVNRYKYDNSKGLLAQFGVKVFEDRKLGGQNKIPRLSNDRKILEEILEFVN